MSSTFDSKTNVWSGLEIPYPFAMNQMYGDLFLEHLSNDPKRIIQIDESDDATLTKEQLKLSAIRVAQHLQAINIGIDDVIGIISHQSHFATSFIHGCILMGAIVNPLDSSLSENDIRHVFNQTKPKIIVCDSEAIAKLQKALNDVDFDYRIYSTSEKTSLFFSAKLFFKPTGYEKDFKIPKFLKPSNERILAILCSSGTTGYPKGVCLSHATILGWLPLISLLISPMETKSLCFSPLYWGSGFFPNLTLPFMLRDTRIITKKGFSVENLVEIVEKYKITSMVLATTQLNSFLNSEKDIRSCIESLTNITIGGSIVSEVLRKKFEKIFPDKNLTIAYGLTESSACSTKPNEYKIGGLSVGSMIYPNNSIKIIDNYGRSLHNGQKGEICLKQKFKFLGYYNNPEATANALDNDGFIKTGDTGYIDDNGMLFVIDRKKDVMKYKGIQLNPSEIENVIESMKGVEEVSVVGIPDEDCVSLATAAIVKCQGYESLTEKKVVEFVSDRLSVYKQLHGGVEFFEKLPKTLSGKVSRKIVLEEIIKIRKIK